MDQYRIVIVGYTKSFSQNPKLFKFNEWKPNIFKQFKKILFMGIKRRRIKTSTIPKSKRIRIEGGTIEIDSTIKAVSLEIHNSKIMVNNHIRSASLKHLELVNVDIDFEFPFFNLFPNVHTLHLDNIQISRNSGLIDLPSLKFIEIVNLELPWDLSFQHLPLKRLTMVNSKSQKIPPLPRKIKTVSIVDCRGLIVSKTLLDKKIAYLLSNRNVIYPSHLLRISPIFESICWSWVDLPQLIRFLEFLSANLQPSTRNGQKKQLINSIHMIRRDLFLVKNRKPRKDRYPSFGEIFILQSKNTPESLTLYLFYDYDEESLPVVMIKFKNIEMMDLINLFYKADFVETTEQCYWERDSQEKTLKAPCHE